MENIGNRLLIPLIWTSKRTAQVTNLDRTYLQPLRSARGFYMFLWLSQKWTEIQTQDGKQTISRPISSHDDHVDITVPVIVDMMFEYLLAKAHFKSNVPVEESTRNPLLSEPFCRRNGQRSEASKSRPGSRMIILVPYFLLFSCIFVIFTPPFFHYIL